MLPCTASPALLETLEAFLCSHLKCKEFSNMERINPPGNLFNTFIPKRNEHHVAVNIPWMPSGFALFFKFIIFIFPSVDNFSWRSNEKHSEWTWAMAMVFSPLPSFFPFGKASLFCELHINARKLNIFGVFFFLLTHLEKFLSKYLLLLNKIRK